MTDWIEIDTGCDGVWMRLHPTPRQVFGSFVDCNMATAWVGDRFRIFPGKYGEDPVWGDGAHLKIGEGSTVAEAFGLPPEGFVDPVLPPVAPVNGDGLHGAIWFESIHQDPSDPTGQTLYALYHNENYPSTLPFRPETGEGLRDIDWPPGLLLEGSIQAVPRIGVMKSVDGGDSWDNRGIILEDRDERMIRLPVNKNYCFPGGVGDPSAIAHDGYLYVFFGEYAYPEPWVESTWDPAVEASGQCVSVARLALSDLDNPSGKALRWDGSGFFAAWDGVGTPISALQIPREEGGGAVSQGDELYYWGPSVSWNDHIDCWVMMLGRVDGPLWVGDTLFVSINPHRDLGAGTNSQAWSTPVPILSRPGHTLWYPSLQPDDSPDSLAQRRTCLRLGQWSRLWFKDMEGDNHQYLNDYLVEFVRKDLS